MDFICEQLYRSSTGQAERISHENLRRDHMLTKIPDLFDGERTNYAQLFEWGQDLTPILTVFRREPAWM
jgi:hypothetical protein